MSVIGPRPALWNQDVLIAEREKYNANDVKPGLTGWAQINGRDELEIPVKAKLDGEYVEKESLFFDIKCFLGTIGKVAKDDSVVEGGTGEMGKQEISEEIKENEKKKILDAMQNLGLTILQVMNKYGFRGKVYFIIAIINIITTVFLVKTVGIVGAAISTAISMAIGNGVIMNLYYNKLGLNIRKFWKEIIKLLPAVVIGSGSR